jgi:hypothetical protein
MHNIYQIWRIFNEKTSKPNLWLRNVLLHRDKICNSKFVCALNKHQGQRGMQNSREHIWKRHAACVTTYTRLAAKLWSAE